MTNRIVRKPRRRPFVDDYLSYLLARASTVVSDQFHRRVAESGLTVPVWRVLATLSGDDGLPVSRLAEIVLEKQPTLTRIVDRMESDGLVKRREDGDDRRQTRIHITVRGRNVVTPLLRHAKRHERDLLQDFSTEDVRRLKLILRGLIRHCGEEAA
jgi:DNA-binding MarR family transcriptional regulator